MVIKGMKNTRTPHREQVEIPTEKVSVASIIDIDLKDVKGNSRKLTDLKNKVVILDFTVYNNAESAAHNLALREIYNKYASQGLEIYQVSLDSNEHFWKTASDNLPWVCVRDGSSTYSNYLAMYNVTSLPTMFIIGRDNAVKARIEKVSNVENEVKKLL